MLRFLSSFFLFSCLVCLFARPALAAHNPPSPLPVLVSIAPQKFLVERIAGDAVSVTVMVKPGSDPHSYEPSPSQVQAASAAALWFTLGLPFEEAWVPRITGNAPRLAAVSMISGITRLKSEDSDHDENAAAKKAERHGHEAQGKAAKEHGHEHGGEDPHVWLSPMLVRRMLPTITRALSKQLPDMAARFLANEKALDAELEALDGKLADMFQPVPLEKRIFLSFHPSWRYFAYNYQLTELSIEVDGKEPAPRELQEVANAAKTYGLSVIFVEPQFPRAAARAIAQNLGASLVEADPLAENLPSLYLSFAEKLLRSFESVRVYEH